MIKTLKKKKKIKQNTFWLSVWRKQTFIITWKPRSSFKFSDAWVTWWDKVEQEEGDLGSQLITHPLVFPPLTLLITEELCESVLHIHVRIWVGTQDLSTSHASSQALATFQLGWIGQNHSLPLREESVRVIVPWKWACSLCSGIPRIPREHQRGRTWARMLWSSGSRCSHPLGRAWLEIWVKVHPTKVGGLGQGSLFPRLERFYKP